MGGGDLGKVKGFFKLLFKDFNPSELVSSYILEEYSVSIFRAMKRLMV